MAKVQNPRKVFNFNVFVPGVDPFCCQEVKIPNFDFDIVEHGDTNFDVKTAGKIKIDQLSISKILHSVPLDGNIWGWVQSIQNTKTGGGSLPMFYKRTIIVQQLAPNGVSVLQTFMMEGAWPQKINGIEFSRMKSENTVESIDFCVDEMPVI